MLNEHIELALRDADVHLFEIPFNHDGNRRQLERPDGLDVAPEDQERILREIEAFVREARPRLVVEYRASANRNGRVRWRQARGSLVRDEHGIATHLVGATQDITQLKEGQQETRSLQRRTEQAETELRALNEKFDLAMQLFDFRVLDIDLRGVASPAEAVISRSWNRDGRGLRAITVASFIDHLKQNVLPEDVPRALEVLEAAMRGDIQDAATEFRARNRTGAGFRWRHGRVKVFCDESGVPERCITLSNDVQQLKTAEEEARRVLDRVKSAEEEARRAVELLKLATRLSGVTVWSIDLAEGDLASANATFINLAESLGYEPDEIPADLSSTLELTVHAEDRPGLMAALQAYLDGRSERFEAEVRVIRKDGTLEWNLARGVAIRDADGRPKRLTGTSVFVTRIKQAEAELRAINEKFDLAARIFDFRVTEIDLRSAASAAQTVSNGTGNWYGRSLRAMPLASYIDYLKQAIVPEDLPRSLELLESAIRGDIPEASIDGRVRNPDGAGFRWRLGRVRVYRDESGAAERCITFSYDIDQLKTTQDEARQAAEQLRLATDLSSVSIWRFELENSDLATAQSVTAIDSPMGYHTSDLPRELVARIEQFVPPEDRTRLREAFEDAISGKSPQVEVECRVIQKDGALRWHLERGIVTRDPEGRPMSVTGTSIDITQLKQTQEELQRVKERLELALLGSKACTWDFDLPDGQIVNAVPVFTNAWELCGYDVPSDPDLASQAVSTLLVAEDVKPFTERVQAFFDGTGCEWDTEVRVMHKDGKVHWLTGRGVVVRDERGRATRFIGMSIDITDRKLMERALSESEERFRRTFENAAVGMVLTDANSKLIEYNRRFCEFLGYSPEELEDRCVFDFMDPDEAVLHRDNLHRVVRGETTAFARDTRYFRKDGAVVWGNLTISVIQRHADGTPVHVMGIFQDITERKALEAEIRQGRETLELAMRGSDISVVIVDVPGGDLHDSRWTAFNLWEPMGVDPATVPAALEDRTRLLIHPADHDAVLGDFRAAADSKRPDYYIEHRFFHADGSLRWRLLRGRILHDESGNLSRFIATSMDITRLKQIESELSRAREAAEAANRAKDEFLANVSHEIRTPMNAILGITELVLDSAPSDHQRQLLSTVRSAAKNLLGLINDLLDFSKIAAGKLTLDRAPFSLHAAVGDTLRALAVRAHRKGLELLCHVQPEVPDALDGDAGRLRQVLMNLVDNAIKFTERGEIKVDVEVASPYAASPDEDVQLAFSVRDTGIGIATDKQATIFQAFEQGDSSTTRNYGGTGLGLTISAQLVALMGGSITVESAPEQGSEFRFTARFARSVRAEDLTPPTGEAKSGKGPEHLPPLRILVAEDNEFNVALLDELLRRRGHYAQFARDGRAALDLALELTPEDACDLMLVDLHMPGLDGFQVVRAIREREQGTSRHLPIIALTARSSAQDRERCIAAGMDEFLSKPIDANALWATVERLVRRWSAVRGVSPRVESALLDPRAILHACDGRASLLDKILLVFRENLPNHLARARAALGAEDFAALREAAHTLAGTAGVFSARTADIALTLADAAARQDRESCAALVERLASMCDALLEETATLSIDSLKL